MKNWLYIGNIILILVLYYHFYDICDEMKDSILIIFISFRPVGEYLFKYSRFVH